MSKPKHTPGSWQVDGLNIYSENCGEVVARVAHSKELGTDRRANSNAHLIAQSPDMARLLAGLIETDQAIKDLTGTTGEATPSELKAILAEYATKAKAIIERIES